MMLLRTVLFLFCACAGVVTGRYLAVKDNPDGDAAPETAVAPAKPRTAPRSPGDILLRQKWMAGDEDGAVAACIDLAAGDPARAIELAMSLEGPEAWRVAMRVIQKFPQAGDVAMDALLRHPEYCKPCPVMDAAFECCARTNPRRAWQVANTPGSKFLPAALRAIARGWGEADPPAAMAFARELQPGEQRGEFARQVLRQWGEADSTALLGWLGQQADLAELQTQVPWGSLKLDSREDFLTMLRLVPAEVLAGTVKQEWTFGANAKGWAARMDWLSSLPAGGQRVAAYAGAARVWLDSDPEKALAMLPEITNERLRGRIHSTVAAYRAADSPQAGFAYADALPDKTMRENARRSVMRTWAENDPAAASRHLLSEASPDIQTIQHAIREWARLEPEAATIYAAQHDKPLGDAVFGHSSPLNAAMSRWASDDPASAAGWLSRQPEGAERDNAIGHFVSTISGQQPDVAMEWAASIGDAVKRQSSMRAAFGEWARQDQARASAWLNEAGLDEATMRRFQMQFEAPAREDQLGSSRSNYSNGTIVLY